MNDQHLKEYYVYSPFLRLFHWIMVGCILTLFATGLYIGNPFFIGTQGMEPTFAFRESLSMETIRFIHFGAAYLLVAVFILRVYGFVINRGDRLFPRFWTKEYYANLIDITLHYLFLRYNHRPYLRNPLARTSYVAVYILILVEIITGFAMYVMVNPNSWGAKIFGPVNNLLGNEYTVHLIHHYVAWAIIIFVVVHVYMAARADFMDGEGEISSMFSGKKFLAHKPVDLGDIVNEGDHRTGNR